MKRKFTFFSLLITIFILLSSHKSLFAQPPGKGYKLLFEDNFDGKSVREDDWSFRLDRRQGGSFNALNRKENVSISGGYLHVAVRQDTINGVPENTGGGLISKRQFGYGYYECLSKPFMAGTGVHSAFWQAGGADPEVYNKIFEIDSYEIDSKTFLGDNNLYVHISPKDYSEVPWPHRAKIPMSYRQDGWLLDAFEYTPEGVIYYDNGKVVAKAEWKELTAAQKVWLTALNGFGKVEKDKQPGESLFDYFRYYAKDYPGVNILPNGNFEYNQDKTDSLKPVAWRTSGTPGSSWVSFGKAFRDHYFLKQGSKASNFLAGASQKLEFIMNGNYSLTARIRSSGGQKTAELFVADFGGKELSCNIGQSSGWKEISINNILVSNNGINVGIRSEGNAGQWLEIDDIQLFKSLPKDVKKIKPEPFVLVGDPIWHLAKQEPIRFTGDQKFYFFDRNVGFGEAISVSFVMNPDTVANMTPIARIPQKGDSGWALQLTENGSLVFRIGSQENHRDVIANAVYRKGKKTAVACRFNKGTAEIFIDGVMVKREEGILQSTMDKNSAGRLGDVGEQLQVIADVFIPLKGETGNKNVQQKNITRYKGTLQNIRVFNRSITQKEIINNISKN
ncbi:MAG: LamG-like jellyroll fold domain-containing protein [Prolixibacteraceae bacterium]